MPGIEWVSSLDNSSFVRSMNEMTAQIRQTKSAIEAMGLDASSAMERMNGIGSRLVGTLRDIGAIAGITFSVAQAKSFVDKIEQTRAYFQDIESSMKVFLGSEKAASDFTSKLKDYAYYNMFEFSDLANASKQMIAYKHDVDTIIPRLDQLSNVARGTNAPLMEMVNAYNKAKNLGGLDGRDLQSWAAKGLIVKDILKEMGETVQGNRVSFEQLNKVLDKVTGEGGMFHNLMGEQMNNISAEQGQLEDTLASMYNELGEKYQDTIVKWYKMNSEIAENFVDNTSVIMDAGAGLADFLIEHYKEIGITVMSLVAAVGEYKASMIALNAIKGAQQSFLKDKEIKLLDEAIAKEKEGYEEVLALKERAKNADLAESVAKGELTEKQAALIAAKRAELEQLQVSKETLAVDHQINELKALKLDEDLQEKVATQQLTLAQAEEVQQRRAVLESLEQEIAKRKELKLAKVEGQIKTNKTERQKKIEENESLQKELTETPSSNVRKQDEIYESIAENKRIINELDAENADLLKEQEAIIIRYGTKDEKLAFLENKKQTLQEQLDIHKKEEASYNRQLETLLSVRKGEEDKLNLLREQWEAQRKENRESEDGGDLEKEQMLRNKLDAQEDKVNMLNDLTHAQKESKLETLAQAEADKVQQVQEELKNITEKEGLIITQADSGAKNIRTQATAKEIMATKGLTVTEKIHAISLSSSSTATKIFTVATLQARAAMDSLKTAIMTNPLGIFIGALTLALPYLMNWVDWSGEAKNTQDALNDSVENFKKKLSDNETEERKEIKTIQDKNASLYDQYRAYQELIKARKIFADYSQEQLASMSSEEIDALFSRDNANKQREFIENERKALEEFREWAKNRNAAWATANDKEKLQEVANKYSLPQETVEEWWKSVNWNTDWSEWSADMLNKATEGWQQRLEDEASAGIASGLKKGFSDHSVQAQATSLLSEFSSYVESTSSDDLEKNGENIATSFKERLMPAIDETKAKIAQLRDEWSEATGDKKVSVKAELDSSEQMLEFLNSIMSLFEGGVNNKELVVKIQRESENAQLGADVLQDIGKDYEEVDKVAEKYLGNLELATQKAKEMGAATKGEAQEIAKEFGLTKEGLEENLGSIEKRVKGEIDDLQDKYIKARDEVARNKLQIEIQRRQELLDHITAIKDRVYDVIKNPYNLVINIGAKIAEGAKNFLKGLLGKEMPSFWEDGGKSQKEFQQGISQKEKSQQAKSEAEATKTTATTKENKTKELTDAEKKAREKAAKEAQRKAEKAAADAANRRHKLADIERRETERLEKQRIEMENAIAEARIAEIRDDGERERAERENQYRLTMQKIREKEKDYRKQNLEIIAQRWEANNKNKNLNFTDTQEYKDYMSGKSVVPLTEDQSAEIMAEERKVNAERARLLEDTQEKERLSLYGYIKEYGGIQQQKAAIAAEYDMKIAKEGDAIQKAALEKQKQRLLSDLTFKEWQQSIDWEAVFNDLNRQSSSALEELKAKLREMLKADGITAENAKVLAEKIRETEDLLSRRKNPIAAWLPGLRERIRLTNDAKAAEDELTAATERQNRLWKLSMADISVLQQKIRTSAGRDVGVQELSSMSADEYVKVLNLDPLGDAAKAARDEFNRLITSTIDLGKAQGDYLKAQENARKRREALDRFTSGGSIAQYFKDITAGLDFAGWANLIGTNIKSMSELVDRIGLGETEFGKSVHDFADGVGGFQSALQSLQNGDVIGAVNGIIGGFEGLGRSFGRAFGITVDADYSSYNRLVEQYDGLIGVWDELIDRKSEYIGMSYGAETLKVGKEALDLIEKQAAAYRELGKERLNAGSSAGSSSIGRRISKNMDAQEWKGIADSLGWSVDEAKEFIGTTRMTGLFDLTAEQIKALQEGNQVWWAKLDDDVRKYLESIIENEEKWSAAHSQMMQQLTTTTEENVFSGFLDDLYGIADGSEDVFDNIAESWQQMVNRMVINNLVGAKFQERLKDWYTRLADVNEQMTNGKMTENEYKDALDNLQAEYEREFRKAQADVEHFRDVGIIKASDEAKANEDKNATNVVSDKATYDQFEKYLGIATAQQIALEQIRSILMKWDGGNMEMNAVPSEGSGLTYEAPQTDLSWTAEYGRMIADYILSLKDLASWRGQLVTEIRNLIMTSNEHLIDIRKSNREILSVMTERVDNLYNLMEKKL